MSDDIKKGLMGVTVDETAISKVMPEINSLTYRGYAAQDLCSECQFDEVVAFGKKLNKTLIITRSDKGSIVINQKEIVECESQINLKIIDLTGAGDLFAAGFLHGYINKLSLKESLNKGTEMASLVIQRIGARLS